MSKTKHILNSRVVEGSAHFGDVNMLINYVKQYSKIGKLDPNELVKRLETSKEFGYEFKQYKTKIHKK